MVHALTLYETKKVLSDLAAMAAAETGPVQPSGVEKGELA
jgi:hypothetical protein